MQKFENEGIDSKVIKYEDSFLTNKTENFSALQNLTKF